MGEPACLVLTRVGQLTGCEKARPLGCGKCGQVWFQGFTRLGRCTNVSYVSVWGLTGLRWCTGYVTGFIPGG